MDIDELEKLLAYLGPLGIEHVVVDKALFHRAWEGDQEAVRELRRLVHGLVTYAHIFPVEDTEMVVTIFVLAELGVIDGVRFGKSGMSYNLTIDAPAVGV
jgi:hypothetical protein